MVRADGLAALSMRALGARVGMRAQSLYSYFASKDAIYDALFRDANEQLLQWQAPTLQADAADPVAFATAAVRHHFEFCVADPVRYELLFQRTIPDFTPSPESYAVAVEVLRQAAEALARIGVTDPEALDLWTAVTTGLTSQQIANDPGGDRWQRLLARAVRMLVAEVAPALLTPEAPRASRPTTTSPTRTARRAR